MQHLKELLCLIQQNKLIIYTIMLTKIKSIVFTCFSASAIILKAQVPQPLVGSWNTGLIPTVTVNNAGVGTLTPDGKLEVKYQSCAQPQNGVVVTQMGCSAGQLGGSNNNGGGVIILDPNGTQVVNQTYIAWAFPSSGLLLPLVTNNNKPMLWLRTEKQDNNYNLSGYNTGLIVKNDGKTGINTVSPRCMLDVFRSGGKTNNPTAMFSSAKSSGSVSVINTETNLPVTVQGMITRSILVCNNLTDKGYNRIVQEGDQALIFSDGAAQSNTEYSGANVNGALVIAPFDKDANIATSTVGGIRIDKNGNLDVHGNVRSRKLIVTTRWWADYVFDNNYNLMNLDTLNQYVKINKHLPNMPSEKEILDSGLNISDMQAIQQSKIEELTLYIIKQNEILKQMQNELAIQKEKIIAIETKPLILNK